MSHLRNSRGFGCVSFPGSLCVPFSHFCTLTLLQTTWGRMLETSCLFARHATVSSHLLHSSMPKCLARAAEGSQVQLFWLPAALAAETRSLLWHRQSRLNAAHQNMFTAVSIGKTSQWECNMNNLKNCNYD